MDALGELIPILLIILWTFFSVGAAKKKPQGRGQGRGDGPLGRQPQRQPRGGQERQRERERVGASTGPGWDTDVVEAPRPEDDSAAGMLPEDLWAVLTGQQPRPRPAPRSEPAERAPEPRTATTGEAAEVEEAWDGWISQSPWEEEEVFEDEIGAEPESLEEEPVVVSMEGRSYDEIAIRDSRLPAGTEIEFTERRHRRFHEDLAATAADAESAPPRRRRFDLDDRGSVRRAIVLAEVLGRPVSLR